LQVGIFGGTADPVVKLSFGKNPRSQLAAILDKSEWPQPIDAMFWLCCSTNMKPEIFCKTDNKTANIYVKNYRFKHTCNDDNGIGHRKQQKLAYRIVSCKFSILSVQCQ